MTFTDLGLIPPLLEALDNLGYKAPTPIQQKAIPIVLSGKDLLASAQTGTGKTASFALPILQGISTYKNPSLSPARHPVRALVLLPTRELAIQVYDSFVAYNQQLCMKIGCVYGGVDMGPQTAALRSGIEVLIATPGRLLDHYEQKNLFFQHLNYLVLDEADRMLDMGFLPDIQRIINLLPTKRQTLLFSATFSDEIKKLADSFLNKPETIEAARVNTVANTISHQVFFVEEDQKTEGLIELLSRQEEKQALVFVDTKIGCERLTKRLRRSEILASTIHGDKEQLERQDTLTAFKLGKIPVLVATDIAARGLDIDHLPLVINYNLPSNPEDYIHRIGRTGRSGNLGKAISLVSSIEDKKLKEIEKLIGKEITKNKLTGLKASPFRGAKSDGSMTTAIKKPYPGKISLDFDVNRPFQCFSEGFPKNKVFSKRKGIKKILPALLGGKKESEI